MDMLYYNLNLIFFILVRQVYLIIWSWISQDHVNFWESVKLHFSLSCKSIFDWNLFKR